MLQKSSLSKPAAYMKWLHVHKWLLFNLGSLGSLLWLVPFLSVCVLHSYLLWSQYLSLLCCCCFVVKSCLTPWAGVHQGPLSMGFLHRYTCVPHPEPSSLLPPCTIPLVHPCAPAPSIQYRALNWTGDSFLTWYYTCFNAILPNHPPPHRVQKTVLYISVFFCCLVHRVIVTIFLNSIYMR